jgi:hypothetical protein
METPGSVRQYYYRIGHPQINVTFRDLEEHRTVKQACIRTGCTPREVLLNWARQLSAEPQRSVHADNRNTHNQTTSVTSDTTNEVSIPGK